MCGVNWPNILCECTCTDGVISRDICTCVSGPVIVKCRLIVISQKMAGTSDRARSNRSVCALELILARVATGFQRKDTKSTEMWYNCLKSRNFADFRNYWAGNDVISMKKNYFILFIIFWCYSHLESCTEMWYNHLKSRDYADFPQLLGGEWCYINKFYFIHHILMLFFFYHLAYGPLHQSFTFCSGVGDCSEKCSHVSYEPQ